MGALSTLKAIGAATSLTAAVAREKIGLVRPATEPHEVPHAASAITEQWLTHALCKHIPNAHVARVEVLGGDDGTSSRRTLAVEYNDAGRAAGLPSTLFSKSTATIGSRLLLGLTGITEGEAVFYTSARPTLTLRSPISYFAGYDGRAHRSMVLLEDLSVKNWTFPDPMANPVTYHDALDIVDQLARYHGNLWESERLGQDLARIRDSLPWQENPNSKFPFERRVLKGMETARDVIPDALYRRRSEVFPKFMRSLQLHRESPKTLLHQDLHLGNWLRDESGQMGLHDWQCVAKGHWALDYSYAIAGCVDRSDREQWQEDLLRSYLDRLTEYGAKSIPDFDQAWLAYRQQPLHALAFGLFTLGGSSLEPELQPREYTISAIGRIASMVDDLTTLDSLD
ncbi:phosphotransferase [Gordonia polyisoprenivorans]|uniref:phosphotransferase n=1 Tax=Gordonia polyisoprenivorans TaxID=84595 RepID=UPI001AD777DA|nr:phosphotransferase [Gordonia polyisoprenivorans]QTI69016.1 phosphotransferase [Gordonia polyisoprenivorans]